MKNPKTLIVGAGPTGLAVAATLAKSGIPFRIVDKNSHRSEESKAIGVQAGTLECLETILGENFVSNMLTAGTTAQHAYLHIDNSFQPLELKLHNIPSKFNFILMLAQSDTERIFEEYLESCGIKVEREKTVVAVNQDEKKVNVTLNDIHKNTEEALFDFVIGADGAHSVVRSEMNVPFHGGTYDEDFALGDVKLSFSFAKDAVHVFLTQNGIIAVFPLKGQGRFRLIIVKDKFARINSDEELSGEKFKKIVNSICPKIFNIEKINWLSQFKVHHRVVTKLQFGRVFIAGDAAHIHSPVGGQGMNIGIQDALNLTNKLKNFYANKINFEDLQDYERQRLPVAKKIVFATNIFSKIMFSAQNRFGVYFLSKIFPRVLKNSTLQKKIVRSISEVEMAKREKARYDA